MPELMKPDAGGKVTAVLLVLLVLAVCVQSVFLFRLSRDVARARPFRDGPAAAEGRPEGACPERAEREGAPGVRSPGSRALRGSEWFSEPDEFWRGMDRERWDPFAAFQQMRERMNHLFDDSFGRLSLDPDGDGRESGALAFSPSLDLQEKGESYVARMDIPGADKPKLSVTLEDRLLTVSGQINASSERKEGDHVLRKERRSGKFQRSVLLPGAVAADAMTATYENGVLTVTVPKAKGTAESKTIQVK